MTAERLEQIRLAIADMYWEVSNNQRDTDKDDREIAIDLALTLNTANNHLVALRERARSREAGTR